MSFDTNTGVTKKSKLGAEVGGEADLAPTAGWIKLKDVHSFRPKVQDCACVGYKRVSNAWL
jgi:hypothetical protein